MTLKFSVAMSVYAGDSPHEFSQALQSIVYQTLPPTEIILVVDGPIPTDLHKAISLAHKQYNILKIHFQTENKGLGASLRFALSLCQYDYVARMDSDDIALPNRFEKQMAFIQQHPEASVVGGMISEFEDDPSNIVSHRILPQSSKDIRQFMQSRNGINHVTAILKKADILSVGGYQSHFLQEDYFLWIRMLQQGFVLLNMPDILVNVRSGRNQFARRGGIQFFKDVIALNYWMWKTNFISFGKMLYNIAVRFMVQFIFPSLLRTFIYQRFLRKTPSV